MMNLIMSTINQGEKIAESSCGFPVGNADVG